MMGFFFSDANFPFMGALAIVAAIGFMELIGLVVGFSFLGHDTNIDHHFHIDHDGVFGHFAGFLGFGKVPFMMVLTVLIASFGISGLLYNWVAMSAVGIFLPIPLAVALAIPSALAVSGTLSKLLVKVLPRDETYASTLEDLEGLTGVIGYGAATFDRSCQATVYDTHGTQHNVTVRSVTKGLVIPERTTVRLEQYDPVLGLFYVTPIH